jgi:hypothetical protein
MAAKKKTKKPASPARKRTAAKKARARAGSDVEVAARLLADLPRLTDADRDAFRGQFTDAQCDEIGGKTKSAAVLREAKAWAQIIQRALRTSPHALRRYGETRFAWLVECIRALEAAIEKQSSDARSANTTAMDLDLARIAAFSVRNDLRDTLTILAGADAKERDALASTLSAGDDDRGHVAALHALADLADWWLKRDDPRAKTLVTSVSLGAADVEAARSAAAELATAANIDTVTTSTRDTPSVDVAEGRVLLEMKTAMGVFGRARETTKAVPALVPGAGTRSAIG